MMLRSYQVAAIDRARDAIRRGVKRMVLVAPTGAGKSVIAHAIIKGIADRGKRGLFAVNRVQLVNQFSERISAAGMHHGILRGEDTRSAHANIVVGSIQTIARRGVDDFDVIVIDEAHAAPGSKDYRKLLTDNPGAIVLGLTATPYAKGMGKHFDGMDGPLFQELIKVAAITDLIKEGHLVDADIWAPSVPDMSGAKKARNAFGDYDYTDASAAEVMDKAALIGDIIHHWKERAAGSTTVAFGSTIAHSMHIAERFREAGVTAEHLSAYTPLDERQAILKRHASGETTVVACAALLREGWDSPECSTLILARPTKSLTAYIQMCGRVLRPYPGKSRAIILDHSGSCLKLGFPTDDREMELDDGKPKEGASGSEPDELKPCPKCGYVDHYRSLHGNRDCPQCGFIRQRQPKPVETQEGELVLLKRGTVTMAEKQRFYGELLTVADDRGYARGWISHKYRAKFGVWPKGMIEEPRQLSPQTRDWLKSQQIRYIRGKENRNVSV